LLENVARLLAQTDADALCRPQPLDWPHSNFLQKVIAAARASWLGHGRDSTIYATDAEGWVDPSSAGAIYRRRLFEQLGGFDENFDACEDVEFNYRIHQAGGKAYLSPRLTVFYAPRKTLSSLFRQMFRYGRGRMRLLRKHPSTFSFCQFVPAAFVLAASLGLVAPWTPLFGVWLALMAAYAGIVMAESIRIATRAGMASLAALPLAFFTIHAGLGCGLIFEWVAGEFPVASRVVERTAPRETSLT
jgi:hypothetical protein